MTVICGSYYLFTFTRWIFDEERRIELGWSLVFLVGINVILNLGLASFIGIKQFYLKIKHKYLKQ